MEFATEADLVLSLRESMDRLFPAVDLVEIEVPSRLGIADLVGARTSRVRLDQRLGSKLEAVLLPGAAQLIAAMDEGEVPQELLFASAGLQRSYGLRLMRSLAASGHVQSRPRGWSRARGLVDPYDTVIAIEAKLDDWKRALSQALRYSYYADFAYVALPSVKAAQLDFLPFHSFGVGVISVGRDAEIALEAPPSGRAEPWRRFYVSELLTARGLARQQPHATSGTVGSRYPRASSQPALVAAPAY